MTRANATVCDAVENARVHRHMVWLAGGERTGKTTGAAALARAHPESVVVVPFVSDADDRLFYEVFARAVGCAVDAKDKAGDLKRKIVQAVRNGDQVLVLDEAAVLFGPGRQPTPRRADWLRTAILNLGVPVVLIFTGMNFMERIAALRKSAEWNCKQFEGRRGAFFFAPEPDKAELLKVAKHYLPKAHTDAAAIMASAAIVSEHRLPTVIRIANEANRLAGRAGRQIPTVEDVAEAASLTIGFDSLMLRAERGELNAKGQAKRGAKPPLAEVDDAASPPAPESPVVHSRFSPSEDPLPAALSRRSQPVNIDSEAVVAGLNG